MAPEPQVEIDSVSFQVRAQKFRVAATIMKRTRIPVATEYATRLVHLVKGIRLDDMAGFFDFEPGETKVLTGPYSWRGRESRLDRRSSGRSFTARRASYRPCLIDA